jgi:hypothetical protein
MTLHKITDFYTEWFSICHNIISKFWTTSIFKSSIKENNDSHKTCMSMIFHWQPTAMLVVLVFRKSGLIKSVQPSKVCQHVTFHGPTLTGANCASSWEVWRSHHCHCHIQELHQRKQKFWWELICEISSSHGGEYDVQSCLLGYTAV